ncbi:MAG: Molybdate/tungstate transport system permease protein WtpB [Candidatus Bathyarchaeota archaeon BA1]|nr:MAG: Molybdate/tungstate transport system permease protein WtpB [Candidatus Bathyarchaeota archaeon BA1]
MRRLLQDPIALLLILFSIFLFVTFVVWPLINLVWGSLFVREEISLNNYVKFFSDPPLNRSLFNTLFMCAVSSLSSLFLGFLFAYLVVRTDVPGKRIFEATAILPIISPPFVVGLSFILLFGRRGFFTYGLFGQEFEIYGWHGLWAVQTLTFFPLAYLLIVGVLRALNPSLEYAAHNLGANGREAFRTVTLPLLMPGLLGASLLVASSVLADFGNPLLIAGDFRVLPTEAYAWVMGLGNYEMASALCVFLLIPAIVFFFLQDYWLRRRSYITIGRTYSPLGTRPINKWIKWFVFIACLAVVVLLWLIYGGIFFGGIVKTWGVDYSLTSENLWYVVGRAPALRNALIFAGATGLINGILGVIVAYLISRKEFLGRRAIDLLSVLSFAIPGTVMGIGFVLAFNKPPLLIHGTAWAILLNMIIRELPVGVRAGKASFEQISPSIEEASANLGANTGQTLIRINLPLLKTAFTGGLVYSFIRSINTVSSVIFLVTPRWNVATTFILGLAEHAYWGYAAALSSTLILITIGALMLFRFTFGKKAQLFQI